MLHEFNQITLSAVDHTNILDEKMSQNKYFGTFKISSRTNDTTNLRRRRVVTTEPTLAMKGNRVISTPVKMMKIMADVGSTTSDGVTVEDERVLCSIKVKCFKCA